MHPIGMTDWPQVSSFTFWNLTKANCWMIIGYETETTLTYCNCDILVTGIWVNWCESVPPCRQTTLFYKKIMQLFLLNVMIDNPLGRQYQITYIWYAHKSHKIAFRLHLFSTHRLCDDLLAPFALHLPGQLPRAKPPSQPKNSTKYQQASPTAVIKWGWYSQYSPSILIQPN